MTLSPNTTTSNSRFAINLFKMFLLGLLLAFASKAQTPITPHSAGFTRGVLETMPERRRPLGSGD
jgi:hypothetical protein